MRDSFQTGCLDSFSHSTVAPVPNPVCAYDHEMFSIASLDNCHFDLVGNERNWSERSCVSPAVLVDANGFALSGNLELRATVERLDPAIDQIVPQRPVLQKVAMGFNWTEGPIWIRFGYLLFTDIPDNLNSNGISNSRAEDADQHHRDQRGRICRHRDCRT